MRILHVYKAYYPVLGGIENHIRLLAEEQAARGHDVTVLVTASGHRTTTETLGGVHVIKAARLAEIASTPISLSLPRRLYGLHPDITHLHFPYPPGELAQLPLLGHRPTVLSYHSDVVRQKRLLKLYRPLMMRCLQGVDCILVSSPTYLETSAILARVRERCLVLPFGIAQERFRKPSPEAQTLRRTLGPGPVILFVGVLRYYKGLRYLLEAMRQVPARLVIVGEGPEGPALQEQTQALGLNGQVTFTGRVEDEALPAYYQAADIFCLPASERSEAFGLVQVEALSAGLPIVSTELGTGTSYVNKDGVSGLVVPARNPAALADALNTLIADTALRQRLAEGARQRAEIFTAERMLNDMDQVYSQVLAARMRH